MYWSEVSLVIVNLNDLETVLTFHQRSVCRDYHRACVSIPNIPNEPIARLPSPTEKRFVYRGVFEAWFAGEVYGSYG